MQEERLKALISEFEQTCDDKDSALESANFAEKISDTFNYERSDELKYHFLNQLAREKKTASNYHFLFPAILVFVILFGLVIKVEASSPGETLYPVKLLTHQVYDDIKTTLTSPFSDKFNIKLADPGTSNKKNAINQEPEISKDKDSQENKTDALPSAEVENSVLENTNTTQQPINAINQTAEEKIDEIQNKVEEVEDVLQDPQNTLGL